MPPTIVLDTEWGYRDGRRDCETAWEPVVLCARVAGGDAHHFWGGDLRLRAFLDAHPDHTFVAHSATAEIKYLLRLGIPVPAKWFDTMVAFRVTHNQPGRLNASLVTALNSTGLSHLVPLDKDELRERIVELKFTDADRPRIRDYCFEDVAGTAALHARLAGRVDPTAMTVWMEYAKAVARMELRGLPIDTRLLKAILANRGHIAAALIADLNRTCPVYDGETFKKKRFLAWAAREGIRWPVKPSRTTGRLYHPLDDDTLEEMENRHPLIADVRQTRKTIKSLQKHGIKVDGRSGRHHSSTMPFRSITGRNQPRMFLFAGPKWTRRLAVPPSPDHALVYVDFVSQEIGVAAALSSDTAMRAMYGEDVGHDPHLEFARMSGAIVTGMTELEVKEVRKIYKTVNLAVLYNQTAGGIAQRLGISEEDAARILALHKDQFHVYHLWSERVVAAAYHRKHAVTPCGWRADVPFDSKWRTWSNFPIQGGSADVMRLVTIALDRQGVQVLAIVHDGWLMSCRKDQIEQLRAAVEHARRWACEKVLGGFPLRVDFAVFAERFEEDDDKVRRTWEKIAASLPGEVLCVPAE
ncbi:DNA polymerase [Limnoglobus roseus]|uniref:DNA-directed DNA polymerase n=1 Tax=Limnoglobus roseus TaxID=2598579 RepID=A0A5C1A689_9BACT|nr:DNA polymerase [Limnoglobus roseus]QEL13885.1 DNA polymerase I [Limnoglobus roseus]